MRLESPHERPFRRRCVSHLFRCHVRSRLGVRVADAAAGRPPGRSEVEGGPSVNWIYVVAAGVAAVLLVYLLAALLKPEWFQ